MQLPFTGERYVPELRGQIYYEHVHRYALALELARDLDVLDIASGEGYGAAYLAIVARSVVGVDIDPASVRHAAMRYTAMNLSFRTGSCTRMPLADDSVDLVVSFETIEHIEEHEQFMREIERVLRPHGRLLISSPNKLVYSDLAQFRNPFHTRELYFDEFRDLLQTWFPYCRMYGQRIIATSAIHPLRGTAHDARCVGPSPHADERGLSALPAPVYFVALCSRSEEQHEGTHESLDSIFVDPRDDLLQDIVHPELFLAQPSDAGDAALGVGSVAASRDVAALPAPMRAADATPSRAAQLSADEAYATEIAGLRAALAAERECSASALAERDASLRRAEGLEREAARLQAHVTQLEQDRSETQALRATAEDAEERFASAVERANVLEQDVAAAESRARAAAEECRSLQHRVDELGNALRDAAVRGDAVLEQNVAAAESRARTAAEECRSLQHRVDELGNALRDAAVRGEAVQADLASARAEAAQSRNQVNDILHSTSWRMTKPLRQAFRPFRRRT